MDQHPDGRVGDSKFSLGFPVKVLHKNRNQKMSKIPRLLREYREMFRSLIERIEEESLLAAAQLVQNTYEKDQQIFTAGNGGSAAIATHFAADFGKNVAPPEDRLPRMISLCSNVSTITALGNDCGYERVFEGQLRNLLNSADLVVLISSSGNSPNIILAAEYAKSRGASVLGLTGFDGGKLAPLCDVNLHAPSDVYELVEDVHSFFTHAIIHAIKKRPHDKAGP